MEAYGVKRLVGMLLMSTSPNHVYGVMYGANVTSTISKPYPLWQIYIVHFKIRSQKFPLFAICSHDEQNISNVFLLLEWDRSQYLISCLKVEVKFTITTKKYGVLYGVVSVCLKAKITFIDHIGVVYGANLIRSSISI